MTRLASILGIAILGVASIVPQSARADVELLNVSYDPTRELYQEFNAKFAEFWKSQSNETVTVQQSHGGSGKQARAVIDGLEADVVTLALGYDIDVIAEKGKLLPADWQARLPNNSSPYTSTIVLLVRKGNPKQIHDFADLAKPGVSVVAPNPKTGGGARWNYLAIWGSVLKHELGDVKRLSDPASADAVKAAQAKAREITGAAYRNAAVLDTGARGSLTTFAQRGIGDVLIAWENEALLATKELGEGEFEVIIPSSSILAEPSVAVVDKNVDHKGTRKVAEAYLNYLYSPKGQEIAAKHYYRPRLESVAKAHADVFPAVELFTIEDVFGGWKKAQAEHFNDGGVFDQIYTK